MKRHVLALAALAAFIGAAQAQSSVTVYGLLDAAAYHKQLAGEAATYRVDNGGMTTSFLAFRGTEDLGGGLSAIFDLSSYINVDTGVGSRNPATDTFWSRSAWVGLDGSFGTVRAGRQTTLAFINLVRYSAFGNSSAFGPSLLHNYVPAATQPMMTGSGSAGVGDSGWSNTAGYTSPSLGGVVGALIVSAGEGTAAGRRVGASLNYTGGAFAAGLAVENIDRMSLNFSKPPAGVLMATSRIANLGVSYDFKVVKVFGQVIGTKLSNASTEIELTTVQLSAAAPISAGQLLVAYADTRKTQTAVADQKRTTASVGYDYYLSKRTDVYAIVMNDKVTGMNAGTGVGVGIRHRF